MAKKEGERRGRPRKHTTWTAELLAERAREYFNQCDSRMKTVAVKDGVAHIPAPAPYTLEGLCCYLDITVQTFRNWRKMEGDSALAQKARMLHQKITENRVSGALDGTQNSAFARFMLVNNNPDDYREKVEVGNSVSESVQSIFEMAVGSWKNKLKP